MGAGGLAVFPHPFFLLGSPQADKYHVRPAPADGLGHRPVLLKIPVVGAGNHKTGVLGPKPPGGLLRHPWLGPQEVELLSVLRHLRHQALGELDARQPLLQRRAQELSSIDDPHAVGDDKVGPVHRRPGLRVLPADLNNLRIGGGHVVGPLGAHQAQALCHRLVHGDIIKAYAQYINAHEASPFSNLQAPRQMAISRVVGYYTTDFPLCLLRKPPADGEESGAPPHTGKKSTSNPLPELDR